MVPSPLTDALRETLALFDESGTPWTTSEVAERLDLGRRSTYERLERLADRDRLATKKVGASARVWWRPHGTDGTERSTPDWPAAAAPFVDDVLDGVGVGVIVLDDDSTVVWMNEAIERYFGLDSDHALGQKNEALVEEQIAPVVADSSSFAETVEAATDENTDPGSVECHVTPGPDREERWLEHRSEPIESGAYAGARVELYHDVSDVKRAERAHLEAREQLNSLVAAVEEYAIFTLDAEGRVQTWGAGAELTTGYAAEAIRGEHVSTFYTERDRDAGTPEADLRGAAAEGSIEEEGWRVRADGTQFWARVTVTAIRDDGGDLQGYVTVTRDMTERREYEQQLREERDFTRLVLETAPSNIVVVDRHGEIVTANDQFRDWLGDEAWAEEFTIGNLAVYDESGTSIPSAERPYTTVFETGDPVFDWQCQVELPSGETRWLSINVTPLVDEDGEVERAVVVAQDVTQLRTQAQRLERQRDDLETELDEIYQRVDDGVLALDDEFRLTYVNERGATLLGYTEGDLVGRRFVEVFPGIVGTRFEEETVRTMRTQESTTVEAYFEPMETWFEASVYPSETGVSVYFRDVTDRKEREQELVRYETIIETMNDGVYTVDDGGRFTFVNDRYAEQTGYEPAELVGEPVGTVLDDATAARASELERELFAGERDVAKLEAELETKAGNVFVAEATFAIIPLGNDEYERVGVVRDITERKERERELEESTRRLQTLVDNFPNGAVTLVSEDLRYVTVGGTPLDTAEASADHLKDRSVREVLPRELADVLVPRYEDALDGTTSTFEHEAGGRSFEIRIVPVRDDDGNAVAAIGMSQDVTERKRYERALEQRVQQLESVTELGTRALQNRDLDELLSGAADRVAEVLGTEYCKVLELDTDAEELLLRQGVGWTDGTVGSATVSAVEADSQAAHTLTVAEPVVVTDLDAETRFSGPDLLTDHDVQSGISVVIGHHDDPWGILSTHDTARREFSDQDVTFVQSVANILANAIDRATAEEALLRQREQLARLNALNEVVHSITDAVIDQSTREEIEHVVCENLVATNSYSVAWIDEERGESPSVKVRTGATREGSFDDLELRSRPDGDAEYSDRPTESPPNVAEGEGQGEQSDSVTPPTTFLVDGHDADSVLSIPVVHEELTYGVLNVYSDRPDAFRGRERAVLDRLGEVIGHAIAASKRKQALMSDEVVELEYELDDVFAAYDVDGTPSGRITLDHSVPLTDDEFLVYGSATPDAVWTLERLVETIPHWVEVTVRDRDGDTSFELRLSEPPVISAIASVGGSIETAVIADGDLRVRIHASPGADVRQLTDIVRNEYPAAELLTRRQITRRNLGERGLHRELLSEFTDRQRTVLTAAYRAGYFEWPREASGEDVAESLGISPPTFHQHLRKAELRTFETLLSEATSVI